MLICLFKLEIRIVLKKRSDTSTLFQKKENRHIILGISVLTLAIPVGLYKRRKNKKESAHGIYQNIGGSNPAATDISR